MAVLTRTKPRDTNQKVTRKRSLRSPKSADRLKEFERLFKGGLTMHQGWIAKEILVSPVLAEWFLQRNENNRRLSGKRVFEWSAAMTGGDWITCETIAFDLNGNVLNGQHRLTAVIKSDGKVYFLMVFGLPPTAFEKMDTGQSRNLGQMLSIYGEKNTRSLAAALRLVADYERNPAMPNLTGDAREREGKMSVTKYIDLLDKNPTLRDCVGSSINHQRKIQLTPATLAFIHHILRRYDRKDADTFMARLIDGAGLCAGDPLLVLRSHLASLSLADVKPTRREQVAMVFKCWNLRQAGEGIATGSPRKIMYAKNERFPLIKADAPK